MRIHVTGAGGQLGGAMRCVARGAWLACVADFADAADGNVRGVAAVPAFPAAPVVRGPHWQCGHVTCAAWPQAMEKSAIHL